MGWRDEVIASLHGPNSPPVERSASLERTRFQLIMQWTRIKTTITLFVVDKNDDRFLV